MTKWTVLFAGHKMHGLEILDPNLVIAQRDQRVVGIGCALVH